MNTLERATGRWPEILPRLGIDTRYLRNKHGPCPLCGGKDRFRFDNRDGTGSYYCNQCGAGNGVILVRKKNGWDHKTACDRIDEIIGTDAVRAPKVSDPDSAEDRRRALDRVVAEATTREIVDHYLRSRGLNVGSDVLLGHPALWHATAKRRLPAVIAPISGPAGALQSLHRIYVGDVEPRKMTMPAVDTIKGGAVRLHEPGEELAVCEGVETGLAVHQLFGPPVWAALSANGVENFQPPRGLWRLTIFADNDSNFTGQAAAFALAKRLGRDGLEVDVRIPPEPDTDWLNVLNQQRGR